MIHGRRSAANANLPALEPFSRFVRLSVLVLWLGGTGCSTVVNDLRDAPAAPRTSVLSADDDRHYQLTAMRASQAVPADPLIGFGPTIEAPPRTIRERHHDVPRNMSLIEAVHLAVRNNPIIRQNGQFLTPTNPLLVSTDTNPSIFDVALQQTGVLFGSRGVDAAWADFFPQLTGALETGRSETVSNNPLLAGGIAGGDTVIQNTGSFDARLEQTLLTGGSIALVHNWDYLDTNQPALFASSWTGALGAEFRQPLLAGAGVDYTTIAGPISNRNNVQSGVAQGIRIAQINEKIACVDFELAIRRLVSDVGEVYWLLFQAFKDHEANASVRDSSYEVWQQVKANEDALGGAVVAQAEQTYLESRSRAENALSIVYETEARLRRLLGLPISDGTMIRPNAIPLTGESLPDWGTILSDALTFRVELQRQKLQIQSYDFQLRAARSLLQPRLDLVGGYQLNGFGNELIDGQQADGITARGYESAYGSLLRGSQDGFNVGVSFSMPIGFQAEQAQVRNLELRSMKARATLATQEAELRYELTTVVQTLARWYTVLRTNEARVQAVQRQVDALEAEYRAGRGDRSTIDLLLRARTALAGAQTEYFRSLATYNTSLWDLDARRGTILLNNDIHIDSLLVRK